MHFKIFIQTNKLGIVIIIIIINTVQNFPLLIFFFSFVILNLAIIITLDNLLNQQFNSGLKIFESSHKLLLE